MKRTFTVAMLGLCMLALCSCEPDKTEGRGKAADSSKTGAAEQKAPVAEPASAPSGETPAQLTLDLGGKVTMTLVVVPAGTFTMGSLKSEKGHSSDEGSQHEVTISKPFYMGVHEVTQSQYQAVMGADPANFKGALNPVEQVNWGEAAEFCEKLSKKTGKAVRLPTEAQWEYACRAGSTTAFHYGDDPDYSQAGEYAWQTNNSETKSHPVGQKKPNAWGLYDMHGNVSEWCSDWYAGAYAGAEARDPRGPESGTVRVLRGGSWYADPQRCRSAYRYRSEPGERNLSNGFRVVVDSK